MQGPADDGKRMYAMDVMPSPPKAAFSLCFFLFLKPIAPEQRVADDGKRMHAMDVASRCRRLLFLLLLFFLKPIAPDYRVADDGKRL